MSALAKKLHAGVCLHCNRSFVKLAEHVKGGG